MMPFTKTLARSKTLENVWKSTPEASGLVPGIIVYTPTNDTLRANCTDTLQTYVLGCSKRRFRTQSFTLNKIQRPMNHFTTVQPDCAAMSLLIKLPLELTRLLLCVWLTPEDVARLDSSFCCRVGRRNLLSIFSSTIFTVTPPGSVHLLMYKWMKMRSIRASKVTVGANSRGNLYCGQTEFYTDLFKSLGPILRDLEVYSFNADLRIDHCHHLQSLVLIDGSFNRLCATVMGNKELSVLRLAQFSARCLDLSPSEISTTFARSGIRKLGLTNDVFDNAVVVGVAGMLPQLVTLDLEGPHLRNETFVRICAVCPNVTHLCIGNSEIDDETLICVLENLTALQSLHLPGIVCITDAAYEVIIAKHAHSLRHLCLEESSNTTEDGLAVLLDACAQLSVLHLCNPHVNMVYVLSKVYLPDLVVLNVLDRFVPQLYGILAQRFSHLKVLGVNIQHCEETQVQTGLQHILDSCTVLRELCVGGKSKTSDIQLLAPHTIVYWRPVPLFDVVEYDS